MSTLSIASNVFACLQTPPEHQVVQRLAVLRSSQVKKLLIYLDQTGLALYLLNHLSKFGLISHLPSRVREELLLRHDRNRARAEDMFKEFAIVVGILESVGTRYAVLKGFSLIPDYTPNPSLRHQTDLDLLLDPASHVRAREALQGQGYELESENSQGETKLVRPLGLPFYGMADIYSLQSSSRVELHSSFWEEQFQVSFDFSWDPLAKRVLRTLRGVAFYALSDTDCFVGQLLHAFRHFLRGWIRPAWLFEIGAFIESRFHDYDLWLSACDKEMQSQARDACGLTLLLCRRLFGTKLPDQLCERFIHPLPRTIQLWPEMLGRRWASSDMQGSKLHLLIHDHFVRDEGRWKREHSTLLMPRRVPSVGVQVRSGGVSLVQWRRRQLQVLWERAWFHLSRDIEYFVQSVRWRRAIHAATPSSKVVQFKALQPLTEEDRRYTSQ